MEELLLLGIDPKIVKEMVDVNPYIKDMDKDEIDEKVNLLKSINCSEKEIINIISSNPMYLDSVSGDIIDLISYMQHIGFSNLNILFDSNPFVLNMYSSEIKDYIDNRINNGEEIDYIVDDLESNPFLFDEI